MNSGGLILLPTSHWSAAKQQSVSSTPTGVSAWKWGVYSQPSLKFGWEAVKVSVTRLNQVCLQSSLWLKQHVGDREQPFSFRCCCMWPSTDHSDRALIVNIFEEIISCLHFYSLKKIQFDFTNTSEPHCYICFETKMEVNTFFFQAEPLFYKV